jgi:lipopolysaccharide biosynthesis protein
VTNRRPPRLIAYYLPQYHPIPENDVWWGKGFTEWTNVAAAKPLFKGHYQPHIPADLGFYDLRVPEAREAQAEMALEYGIEGFCYWHYWFAGKRLLERPFVEVLQSGKPDFPFCLAWANQTWTGIWHGAADRVLIEQTYPGVDDHAAHFRSLLPAFLDDRYLKVDGKPLFVVFQPSDLTSHALDTWRDLAAAASLSGLFLVGIVKDAVEGHRVRRLGFDACTISRTSGRAVRYGSVQGSLVRLLGEKRAVDQYQRVFKRPFHTYLYDDIRPYIDIERDPDLEFYPCILPGWDNTPRSGLNGFVFTDASPGRFQEHLSKAVQRVEEYEADHRIIIVKSWNEWAEGNHLEPDLKYGRGFLEAIRDELRVALNPILNHRAHRDD